MEFIRGTKGPYYAVSVAAAWECCRVCEAGGRGGNVLLCDHRAECVLCINVAGALFFSQYESPSNKRFSLSHRYKKKEKKKEICLQF